MKVVAFNGSARTDGNTALLIRRVLQVLEEEGLETELIQLAGKHIHGCNACRTCYSTKNKRCVIEEDDVNAYIEKMIEADGIILGSSVYFSMMTPELKALADRAFYVARANDDLFKRKVGAAVVAVPVVPLRPVLHVYQHRVQAVASCLRSSLELLDPHRRSPGSTNYYARILYACIL